MTGWDTDICLRRTGPTEAEVMISVNLFGVLVPAGYKTDGASVPRAFYNIIARFTDALPAALVHDLRYDPMEVDGVKQRVLTRKEADREFYENLRASGVNVARAQAAYRAVRLFGWKPWNRGTENGTINP